MASPPAAPAGPTPTVTAIPAKPSLAKRAADEVIAILKAALWFVPLWIAFNAVAWAQYSIPSESMVPNMEIGDRVIVAKYAYGYSRFSVPVVWRILPEENGRMFYREPRRGDVVVFAHPRNGKTMIKRAMGLPGDRIEIRNGVLIVNGEEARYKPLREVTRPLMNGNVIFDREPGAEYEETIDGRTHVGIDLADRSPPESVNYGPVSIPDGHFLMLGDNRDNSSDSRFPEMSFVPMERLIGRAETVIFAPKTCWSSPDISCARKRWLVPLSRPAE
jgi:signal peptidase I